MSSDLSVREYGSGYDYTPVGDLSGVDLSSTPAQVGYDCLREIAQNSRDYNPEENHRMAARIAKKPVYSVYNLVRHWFTGTYYNNNAMIIARADISIERDANDSDRSGCPSNNNDPDRDSRRDHMWSKLAQDSFEAGVYYKQNEKSAAVMKATEVVIDVKDLAIEYSAEIKAAGQKAVDYHVNSRADAVKGGYSQHSDLGFQ